MSTRIYHYVDLPLFVLQRIPSHQKAMLDYILQRIFVTIPCFVYDLPRLGCIESTLQVQPVTILPRPTLEAVE